MGYMTKYMFNMPDDLHRRGKIQAAKEGSTLRCVLIRALQEYLEKWEGNRQVEISIGRDKPKF